LYPQSFFGEKLSFSNLTKHDNKLTKYLGLISQELRSYVKSIVGIDMAQGMVDEYNKKVSQQGIDENEMKAICLELKEGDQLNGRKFDLVVVSNDIFQTFRSNL
jgi:predicted TPR repeat methyltransferase